MSTMAGHVGEAGAPHEFLPVGEFDCCLHIERLPGSNAFQNCGKTETDPIHAVKP